MQKYNYTNNHYLCSGVVFLALVSSNLYAIDEELEGYVVPENSITINFGQYSGDREQYGVYDNHRNDASKLTVDANIHFNEKETGTWLIGEANELGSDSQSISASYEKQGDWGVGFDYQQLPHIAPYTVNTGVSGLGTSTQTVPDTTSSYVPGTGSNIVIATERKALGVDYYKYINGQTSFKLVFNNETKQGNRHWGRGGAAEFALEPIDSVIKEIDATVDYMSSDLQIRGGYYGSWYVNQNSLVTSTRGTTSFYLSLPMDNQAHQIYLNGGYNLSNKTRVTLRTSYTHATQNEHLPTADIAGLAASAAPASLQGETNTSIVQLSLNSRPSPNLSFYTNLRYHQVDERTPDWLVVSSGVHSTSMDYETLSGKFEGTYRFGDGYSLIGGIEQKNQSRTVPVGSDADGDGLDNERYVPFRADLTEQKTRIQLRRGLSEQWNGSVSLLNTRRQGSNLTSAAENAAGVITPLHIADRDRNKVRVTLDWAPAMELGLQFNIENSTDTYPKSTGEYGLQNGSSQLVSVDVDFKLLENWRTSAWASFDEIKATQFNYVDASNDNTTTIKDEGVSLGLNLKGELSEKTDIGIELQWTQTKTAYDINTTALYTATMTPPSDVTNKSTLLDIYSEYSINNSSSLRLDLIYEYWNTNDWTWLFSDGSPFVYGSNTDGTMVITIPEQTSVFAGIRYKYRF